jgi:hypothetical protein
MVAKLKYDRARAAEERRRAYSQPPSSRTNRLTASPAAAEVDRFKPSPLGVYMDRVESGPLSVTPPPPPLSLAGVVPTDNGVIPILEVSGPISEPLDMEGIDFPNTASSGDDVEMDDLGTSPSEGNGRGRNGGSQSSDAEFPLDPRFYGYESSKRGSSADESGNFGSAEEGSYETRSPNSNVSSPEEDRTLRQQAAGIPGS